jgi:hypothetical protein
LQNGRRAEDAALAAGRRDIVPVLHGGAPLLGSASVESRRSSMALLEAESGVTGSVTSSIVTNDGDAVSEDSALPLSSTQLMQALVRAYVSSSPLPSRTLLALVHRCSDSEVRRITPVIVVI